MKKEGYKISYVRKPFAKKSIPAVIFSALSAVFCAVSLGLSVRLQGNGGLNIAAWGFSSLVFSVLAVCYGLLSFMEKEASYLLARISLTTGGILFLFWLCMILVGILG